jgi:hypothetical protein
VRITSSEARRNLQKMLTETNLFSVEAVNFHVYSWQCKHVLLGCSYDTGYIPFLGQFAADGRLSSRITLIEGALPLLKVKASGFQTVRFDQVFLAQQHVGRGEVGCIPHSPPISPYHKASSFPLDRFGPVVRDPKGKRIDKQLSVKPALVTQFGSANLCYWLFLRGECRGSCSRVHQYRSLAPEEWDALWLQARRGRCYKAQKNEFCDDSRCVYSH